MASVPAVAPGFFPLDEQLALLPGHLTPKLHEGLVQLGTWMPFAQAADLLAAFTAVRVSPATVRRQTQAAGAAALALETAEADRIQRTYPSPPPSPARLVMSADGAMVPLRHGEWAEVRTLAIGAPHATANGTIQTQAISYFSRLTDAVSFGHLALSEIYRRGVLTAPAVAAVMDGAEWLQGFTDLHCGSAVRILDFAHAAQRIAEVGQALWGEATPTTQHWIAHQLHTLKHTGPSPIVAELRHWQAQRPEVAALATNLAYLEKRMAQMDYRQFQADGWPIGSGMVESGNKLVVEARMKGAGMRWAREQVNPMLALRNLVCSQRWQTMWPHVRAALRPGVGVRRRQRLQRVREAARQAQIAHIHTLVAHTPRTTLPGTSRPAPNHPWKRPFSSRALAQRPDAKL